MGSSSALFVSLALVAVATVVFAVPASLSSEEESDEVASFRSGCIEEGGELKCQGVQFMNDRMTEKECADKGQGYISELMVCDPNSKPQGSGGNRKPNKPKPGNN
ncbi:uncharacterized protein LOC135109263 [Scylla paramamosain]|uniref:uncharacterized protein LOC135109263 n=1 Tax=Scylla paramamosain TaxID=85552 RepID=UPI0030839C2B